MSEYGDNNFELRQMSPRQAWWSDVKRRVLESWRSGVAFLDDLRRLAARLIDPDAPAEEALYTYFVSMRTSNEKYEPGATGCATAICNTPYQVIDAVIICKAATFNLTSFFIGDVNMLLGAGSVPADVFFPMVQNRFVRFTEVERGQTIQVGFVNISAESEEPQPIVIALKVRGKRRS